MSSLIEQAAERLEQLRRAGAVVAEPTPQQRLPGGGQVASIGSGPTLAALPAVTAPTTEPAKPAVTSRRVEIDFDKLEASGVLTPNSPRSLLGDQMRVLKRPLIRNAFGKGAARAPHGNLVMVTSALAGEGKSFTATNLAMSIAAELDHTVLLVDADVARPSISRMLGLFADDQSGPGLLDVLDGSAQIPDVLVRTSIDKLSILPSGTQHARATELLASDAMSRLLADIERRYKDRIIIFDSPPLLLTTEARVLASHMGQVLVVVKAGSTLQSDVQAALSTIESCPLKMMVLNQAESTREGGQGYGYGYGYGSNPGTDPGGEPSILEAPIR